MGELAPGQRPRSTAPHPVILGGRPGPEMVRRDRKRDSGGNSLCPPLGLFNRYTILRDMPPDQSDQPPPALSPSSSGRSKTAAPCGDALFAPSQASPPAATEPFPPEASPPAVAAPSASAGCPLPQPEATISPALDDGQVARRSSTGRDRCRRLKEAVLRHSGGLVRSSLSPHTSQVTATGLDPAAAETCECALPSTRISISTSSLPPKHSKHLTP